MNTFLLNDTLFEYYLNLIQRSILILFLFRDHFYL
jgi:hypothetical protein